VTDEVKDAIRPVLERSLAAAGYTAQIDLIDALLIHTAELCSPDEWRTVLHSVRADRLGKLDAIDREDAV
jgi:hypothetical protein